MIKVIVCGACGKMGSRIVDLVAQDEEMKLAGIIEKLGHPKMERFIEGSRVENDLEGCLNDPAPDVLIAKAPYVIIEFSNPEATLEHLEIAASYKIPMVIGTTGLEEKHIARVKELTKEIPCVMAPNMSMGVNLLFKLVKEVAMTLPGYDAEIVEAHHNQKKDAPSGTALQLAKEVRNGFSSVNDTKTSEKVMDRIIFSYGRSGTPGPRKPEEIGIHSIRGGDIVGEHTVIFAGPGERIELTHRAHSRDVFAHGAIKAAKWIIGKPAGLYDMMDVLEIK